MELPSENEVMERKSTEDNDDGDSDRGEEEEKDEDAGVDDAVGGHVTTASESLTVEDNIIFTQPVTLGIATPSVRVRVAPSPLSLCPLMGMELYMLLALLCSFPLTEQASLPALLKLLLSVVNLRAGM